MALAYADGTMETTTTTGTGTLSLAGAVTSYRGIVAAIGNGNTSDYCCEAVDGNGIPTGEREVFRGVVTDAAPDTLTRATVWSSSNGGSLVNFSAGTKRVYCVLPASKIGLQQEYVGYDTIGGSLEVMTSWRVYAKKITLERAGLMTDIEAYLQNNAAGTDDQVETLSVALYADSSGTPGTIIQCGGFAKDPSVLLDSAVGAGGDGVGRWFGVPLGRWLTAGDYWIAVAGFDTLTVLQLAYDATGSDRYYTPGGQWFADWGFYSPTTTGNQYSIRASVVR